MASTDNQWILDILEKQEIPKEAPAHEVVTPELAKGLLSILFPRKEEK